MFFLVPKMELSAPEGKKKDFCRHPPCHVPLSTSRRRPGFLQHAMSTLLSSVSAVLKSGVCFHLGLGVRYLGVKGLGFGLGWLGDLERGSRWSIKGLHWNWGCPSGGFGNLRMHCGLARNGI